MNFNVRSSTGHIFVPDLQVSISTNGMSGMTIDMAGYYDIIDAECGNDTECGSDNPENDDEDTEDHEDDTTTV